MQYKQLRHHFVEHIPERLEAGVLYVSMEYATSAHSCCCGCGEEVVAPFTPTDWKMTFDGETVSLRPSIGNWTLKCRSHYVIDRGKVVEALLSAKQGDAARKLAEESLELAKKQNNRDREGQFAELTEAAKRL